MCLDRRYREGEASAMTTIEVDPFRVLHVSYVPVPGEGRVEIP